MNRQEKLRKSGIRKFLAILCLSLVSSFSIPESHAWQKNIRFDRISTDQGLSHVFVHSITQDDQGFMWFGTANGLNKYDGHRITVYGHDPDDPTSISGKTINDVYVDSNNVLWAAGNGLDRFDRESESFTHFTHDPDDPKSISDDVVLSIFEDHEGILWIGTWNGGLNQFDRATETFTRFQHDPDDQGSLPAGPIRAIFESADGILWVGTYTFDESANLSRFDRDTETFQPVLSCDSDLPSCAKPLSESDRPPHASTAAIFEDQSGIMWIGGYGLIRYDRNGNTYRRYFDDPENEGYPHVNNFTGDLVQDHEGRLWFADTYNGLHGFDPDQETFTQYLHIPADPFSIGSNDLFTVYKDRDGLIWIASYYAGVSKFDPGSLAFGHYKHDPADPTSLGNDRVAAITEDKNGYLWVAAGGLNKIDRNNGLVELYRHDPEDPDSIHTDDIRELLFDRTGFLWLGTHNGLSRFDPETETFRHYPIGGTGEADDDTSVYSIIEDKGGVLWLGTNRTFSRFDPATGEVVHYPADSETTTGPRGTQFMLLLAQDGHIWIGSWAEGVTRFDPDTESFVHFDHDPEVATSLSKGRVTGIMEDHEGTIWIATSTGVDQYNAVTDEFSHFTNSNELPVGFIENIIPDESGRIWFVSNGAGISSFDPHSGLIAKYSSRDGLQGDFFKAAIISESGELVLGGLNGLNIFHPDQLPEPENDPIIAFTDFLLMNESVGVSKPDRETPLSRNISTNPDITLTHRDYLFSVEFAALSYLNTEATRYAYMLEGFDHNWIETDASKRFATYTNVPAGNYTLRVKATDLNGEWSKNTAALNLKILSPPWKTWWAYTLYLATIVLLLFGYILWRTHTLQRRAIELETTVEERTRQIRENEQVIQHQADSLQELLHLKEKLYANISHEFRTPLTLILGPVRRMLGKNTDTQAREQLEMVQRNSERLLRLVDQLLGLSRLSAQKPPTASAQPLMPLVEVLTESFRPLAQEKGLSLIQGESEDIWVNCAPDALEKILMNLLSNAIKYTPAGGRITVDVCSDGQDVAVLSVSDTGIGIPADEHAAVFERFHRIGEIGETIPGAGIGLALVKELVESYGGSVGLVSSPGAGTTVSIRLPRHEALEQGTTAKDSVHVSAAARREVESLVQPGTTLSMADHDHGDDRRCVLIVEDNPDMQNYLHDLLDQDYECLVAGNGQDGLEVALEQVPDLVVTDVMMPEMDGYELTQTLKEDQRTSHIPIIMLTARSDQESRLKGLRERADDYLIKPFDDEELLLRISNQLAARDIIKARFSGRIYLEEPLSTELNERERKFLQRFEVLLKQDHSDPNLDIGSMASRMAVSTRQLQRKLKALTGHSPAEYLRAYRLKKAAKLLKKGGQITRVALDVGFSSQAYFGTCFKAQFGLTPGQFQREKSQN